MQILDCTLRDGGYYTNWDFDSHTATAYFTALQQLPVDIVEFGYRSVQKKQYAGRFFYSPVHLMRQVREMLPGKQLAIMLDEKDVRPEEVEALLSPAVGLVDMIRIAVAPARFEYAVLLAREIRKLGFGIGLNIMYMSTLTPGHPVFGQIRQIGPEVADALSMVDSYGGAYPQQVADIIRLCRQATTLPLGFHGHNNLELALANALAAIEAGCTIIDATITGMGRGAGNLKTELFLTHLATRSDLQVDFDALGTVVDTFEKLRQTYQWGTNLPYMVSGAGSLPQKDVMDWVSKRYISVNSIIRALQGQQQPDAGTGKLPLFVPGKKYQTAIIVGGGPSVTEHAAAIVQFCNQHPDACLVHASSKNAGIFQQLENDQFFCLVGNEGHRMEAAFGSLADVQGTCVLPPYPRKMGTYIPAAAIGQAVELTDISFTDRYRDSHTAIALQTAIELGALEVYLLGYDGYAGLAPNSKEQDLAEENNYLLAKAAHLFRRFASLTATRYNTVQPLSVYQFIQ